MGEKASGIGQVPALMADHAVGETNVCGLKASLETSCVGNFIQIRICWHLKILLQKVIRVR